MATFIRVAGERVARRVLCGGIRATVLTSPGGPRGGILCVLLCQIFSVLHELRRRGYSRLCGIQFRIDERGAFLWDTTQPTATENDSGGIRCILPSDDDPRGLQVIVPRAISAMEVTALRSNSQVVGWRFYPAAKGRLWPAKVSINATRLRRKIEKLNNPWGS